MKLTGCLLGHGQSLRQRTVFPIVDASGVVFYPADGSNFGLISFDHRWMCPEQKPVGKGTAKLAAAHALPSLSCRGCDGCGRSPLLRLWPPSGCLRYFPDLP